MKKWTCMNKECGKGCTIEIPEGYASNPECLLNGSGFTFKPNWLIEGFLPPLTAEVFDREDCPAYAKIAVVNQDGSACWGSFASAKPVLVGWGGEGDGEWKRIPGKFDAIDWRNSLIERPAKLPEWVKIGGYVFDCKNGYGKIVSGSVKSLHIEFTGGEGDFSPNAVKHQLQQARLRPYNAEEMKALVGKILEYYDNAEMIVSYYNERKEIQADGAWYDAEDLTNEIYTIDGKPCGVLEHMENGAWVK